MKHLAVHATEIVNREVFTGRAELVDEFITRRLTETIVKQVVDNDLISVKKTKNNDDDTVRFAEKAQTAGLNVVVDVIQESFHADACYWLLLPEAQELLHRCCRFVDSVTLAK